MTILLQRVVCSLLAGFLVGCFEINEEIKINKDGSGQYTMLIDFSESASILDELHETFHHPERAVLPQNPFQTIDSTFAAGVKKIDLIWGIENARSLAGEKEYAYGIFFDFNSIDVLNFALDQLDGRHKYGTHQAYYAYKKGKLEKLNVFNLRKLAGEVGTDSLQNQQVAAQLEEMLSTVKYNLKIIVENKVKKCESRAKYRHVDERTILISAYLKEIQNNEVDLSTVIKFK